MSFPYRLTDTIGTRILGLIVLQVDETIEQDFRRIFADPATALYVTRIPSGAELTPETISRMEHDLPRAASLLPQTPEFDAVAYACTSGTTLIGADRVAQIVAANCRARRVTNPLSAAFAALRHMGLGSVGLVSPYTSAIADQLRDTFQRAGIAVPNAVSFGEQIEANVARIDPSSIAEAAREVARQGAEAVFLSCTNLRTLDIIGPLEAELGIPVLSSNQVLAWDMARESDGAARGVGRLFAANEKAP